MNAKNLAAASEDVRGREVGMVRVYTGVRSCDAGCEVVEVYRGLHYVRKEIACTGLIEGKAPGCRRVRSMRRAA